MVYRDFFIFTERMTSALSTTVVALYPTDQPMIAELVHISVSCLVSVWWPLLSIAVVKSEPLQRQTVGALPQGPCPDLCEIEGDCIHPCCLLSKSDWQWRVNVITVRDLHKVTTAWQSSWRHFLTSPRMLWHILYNPCVTDEASTECEFKMMSLAVNQSYFESVVSSVRFRFECLDNYCQFRYETTGDRWVFTHAFVLCFSRTGFFNVHLLGCRKLWHELDSLLMHFNTLRGCNTDFKLRF